jgi:hypothetical protein
MTEQQPVKRTRILCPVCRAIMDTIDSYAGSTDQSFAMVAGDGRREHGHASSECRKDTRWMDGWIEEDVKL